MPGCCAYGYHNRSENGFKMNIFPRNKERCALWAVRVKRDNLTPIDNSYLCEVNNEFSIV